MQTLNKFFEKYSYATFTIIGALFFIIWWASALDTNNKTSQQCIDENAAAIELLQGDIEQLKSKAKWIDRNRQLPERIARLETKIMSLNKQLDRVTNSLDRFNDNFAKLQPFLEGLPRKEDS